MRTCHRALLPATLLLFIALAVLPASAFYNPTTGRWLSRDPIDERDVANLYAFCRNSDVNTYDYLGNLTISPIVPYEAGNCGAFAVTYAFGLNAPAPAEGGYIVQRIVRTESVTYCETGTTYSQSTSYWEAFEVAPNASIASGVDSFAYGGPGCAPSKGNYSISGTAFFYSKSKVGNLDANTPITPWLPDRNYGGDFLPPSCLTSISAGTAPSIGFEPPFWRNVIPDEAAPIRTVSVRWNCCCPIALENMRTRRTN